MLPKLVIFVMTFFLGVLASPVAKPQNEVDVTRRFSGTRWTWYDVQTGNQ
jgi:hypothetical protein